MRSTIMGLVLLVSVSARADWPDLSKPPAAVGGGEKDAALIVGVESYLALPQVPGAVQNATEWYLYLANGLKVPPSNLTLLRNTEASLEKLKKFAALAAGQVKPGGTLWFVFIGHGAPAKDGKDGVLVGFDAQQDADSLYARSLAQGELQGLFAKGAQARTVVVLDACFSGRAGGGAPLVPGLQPVIPILSTPEAKGAPTLILSAGQSDQFAGPLPGVARPAFSYLVLGALRGWGDANGDGQVDAREAVDYANIALTSTVKDRTQTPQLSGPNGLLSRSGKESAPNLASIVVAKPTVGGVAPVTAPPPSVAVAAPVAAAAVAPAPTQPTRAAPPTQDSQIMTIGIPEFVFRGPESWRAEYGWVGGSIADAIATQFLKARQVRVVEREFLDRVAGELKLQASAAVDQDSAVRMGRMLGAKLFLQGTIAPTSERQLKVTVFIQNIERGERLPTPISVVGSPDRLSALEAEVTRQVAKALSIELALAETSGLESTELVMAAHADLEQLRLIAPGFPLYGQDPARRGKAGVLMNAQGLVTRLQSNFPRLAPAAMYHALVSLQQDDLDTAATQADLARQLAPGDPEPLLAAITVAVARRDPAAMTLAVEAATRFPDDGRVWFLLGRVQLQAGDKPNAALSLLLAMERSPRVAETESNLQAVVGGPEGAQVIGGMRAQPRYQAAASAYRALFTKDLDRAGPYAMEALRSTPALPIGALVMGMIERRNGNLGRAEQLITQALALRPDSDLTHRELAEVLLAQRRCDEARHHADLFAIKATVIRTGESNDLEQRLDSCR